MSKPHRGSSLRELFKHGRGDCPVCGRKNVKVLYEQEKDGQKFKICKTCKASIKNGTKNLPVVAQKAPVAEAAPEEKPAKAVEVASTEKAAETETAAEEEKD